MVKFKSTKTVKIPDGLSYQADARVAHINSHTKLNITKQEYIEAMLYISFSDINFDEKIVSWIKKDREETNE